MRTNQPLTSAGGRGLAIAATVALTWSATAVLAHARHREALGERCRSTPSSGRSVSSSARSAEAGAAGRARPRGRPVPRPDPRADVGRERSDGRQIVTRYDYDPLDQLREVRDAAGNRTQVAYDLAGRRTDIVSPDAGHTEMVYDRTGNLVRRVTPNLRASGQAIRYAYDFNRLVRVDYPGGSDRDVIYRYGAPGAEHFAAGRIGRQFGDGKICCFLT